MKNKKGFVFLESVIVLVVVALALTGFMTTYTLLSNNSRRRERFDNISDKYLLYSISSLGTTASNDYTSCETGANGAYSLKRDTAYECTQKFMDQESTYDLFDTTGLVYLYYVENIELALKSSNKPTEHFDNGAIEYMKTLPISKSNYFIGAFRRNDKFYYASINLDKLTNDVLDSNFYLETLTITTNNNEITPESINFNKYNFNYTFNVSNAASSVSIDATPSGDPETTHIRDLVTGATLNVGKNEFVITVEAQNKQTQKYYIVINRASE